MSKNKNSTHADDERRKRMIDKGGSVNIKWIQKLKIECGQGFGG